MRSRNFPVPSVLSKAIAFWHFIAALMFFVCTAANGQEKKFRPSLKSDVLNFRNQIVRLKEYKSEQKNMPALSKAYGGPVTITIEIDADTTIEDDEVMDPADNIVTGYIIEQTPKEHITAYELHFDRTAHKIIEIKKETDTNIKAIRKKEDE